MSDDEDYMSSAFLETKVDIRPGLLPKSVKRKLEMERKKIESNKVFRTKSRKELEEESRSVGLNSAIGSGNKGFALLQRMGYKPGMKLGPEKSSNSSSGLTEPIKIELKTDRKGLGREVEVRNRREQREERRQKRQVHREQESKALAEEFRERMRNKIDDRRLTKDLRKCQKICEQLDVENGVREPMKPWFWHSLNPGTDSDDDEEQDDEDEEKEKDLSLEERIDFIIEYIRPKYFYCSWCCIKYDNEEDMKLNCPGPDKNSHDDLFD